MKQLDKGSIDTDKIISLAQCAFMNSGHNKPLVARINTDWDTAARINIDWAAAPIKKYVAFKGHYIRELRLLHQHGDTGTNEQAHLTETLQRQVNDLTHRLKNVSATADSVVSEQERFSSEFANYVATTKGTGATDDMSAMTNTNGIDAYIKKEMSRQNKEFQAYLDGKKNTNNSKNQR